MIKEINHDEIDIKPCYGLLDGSAFSIGSLLNKRPTYLVIVQWHSPGPELEAKHDDLSA